MSYLQRCWLNLSLCWLKGMQAESVRLALLNDSLRREGKLQNSDFISLPRWRAEAVRGAELEPSAANVKYQGLASLPNAADENHVLFLTVPDFLFKPRCS